MYCVVTWLCVCVCVSVLRGNMAVCESECVCVCVLRANMAVCVCVCGCARIYIQPHHTPLHTLVPNNLFLPSTSRDLILTYVSK